MTIMIFHHAGIFTADAGAAGPDPEAFAVADGRFTAVGTLDEVRAAVGAPGGGPGEAGVVEVDLGGRFVAPGIIDSHTHLTTMGEALGKVQLRDCRSLPEIQERLVAARQADPEAPRVLGAGWLFDAVGQEHPTAAMLDAVLPDVPVYLDANDLHSVWANTAALEEMGIDADSPDPVGGRIARDEHGRATGLLYETAGRQYARHFLEQVSTPDDHVQFLELAFDAYLQAGVTTVTDMAMTPADVTAIRALIARDGRLPFPVTAHMIIEPGADTAADLAELDKVTALREEIAAGSESDWFRIAGVKFIMDGVIDACTATMRAPYADGTNCDPIWSAERLRPVALAADAAGLQIAMHAIGDRTSEIALDLLEDCGEGAATSRHRLEHLESVSQETIERMARLGVTASMQPVHCDPAILDNWKAMLGDHRAEEGFPWRRFREASVAITLGTDAPTAPHEALPNLYIALTGGSSLSPGLPPYHPERAFTPEEAVTALTAGGARAGEMEDLRGRIRPGLEANFVVLDVDPRTEDPGALLGAAVCRTYVRGEERHRR
ncbi:amidohydrolase [Nesterenkonia suensis]